MWDEYADSGYNNFSKKLPRAGIDGFRYQDPSQAPQWKEAYLLGKPMKKITRETMNQTKGLVPDRMSTLEAAQAFVAIM